MTRIDMSKAQVSKHSCTVSGRIHKVGDTVLVRGSDSLLPYIGKIKDVNAGSGKSENCLMAWFYRPDEAEGGRKQFHGEKELFRSDHVDWVDANTITDSCNVHSLKNYQMLKEVEGNDFFTRFSYQPATKEFKPDRVPVYCVCEMPYNPDSFMVMCTKCEEWYHPKCLGFENNEIEVRHPFRLCSAAKDVGLPDFTCDQQGCGENPAAEDQSHEANGTKSHAKA